MHPYTNRCKSALSSWIAERNRTDVSCHSSISMNSLSFNHCVYIYLDILLVHIHTHRYIYTHTSFMPKRCYSYLPEHFNPFNQLFKCRTAALFSDDDTNPSLFLFFFYCLSLSLPSMTHAVFNIWSVGMTITTLHISRNFPWAT